MSALLSHGGRVSGQPEAVARAVAIDRSMVAREAEWVARLRAQGVRAAHPDDGWVDRTENKVHVCYPQFDDGLRVGDLLALGWFDKWRIVRVTGTEDIRLAPWHRPWYWHFEEVR